MELRIKEMSFPEVIEFNFEEIKQELAAKVERYKGIVYSEEQIKEAKMDVASMRKFVKAMSDERIKVKKQCLKPYEAFEARVKELEAIVNEPIAVIDKQLKEYEDSKKQEKMEQIEQLWAEMDIPEGLAFEKVYEERMLNVSYNMAHVKQKMLDCIKRFNRDIETLRELPEFSFEATEMYKSCLDINTALNEAHRLSEIAKKKAEMEAERERLKAEAEMRKQAEEEAQVATEIIADGVPTTTLPPAKQWVKFQALMTVEQAMELKKFFEDRNIEFKAV